MEWMLLGQIFLALWAFDQAILPFRKIEKLGQDRNGHLELTLAGLVLAFGLLSLSFQVAGGFLLLFGVGLWIFSPKGLFSWVNRIFGFLFFSGLYLFSLESVAKTGTWLLQSEEMQDFVFVLADNRWPAMFLSLTIGAFLFLFFRRSMVTWVLSVLGLALGVMSINVALGLILGEGLGLAIRRRRIMREMITVLVYLIVYSWFRDSFTPTFGLGSGPASERIQFFLVMGGCLLSCRWLLAFVESLLFLSQRIKSQ